jgi:hypothetical protein
MNAIHALSQLSYSPAFFRILTTGLTHVNIILTKGAAFHYGLGEKECRSGEIGRRAGLKIQWYLVPCRFDSDLRHHSPSNLSKKVMGLSCPFFFFRALSFVAVLLPRRVDASLEATSFASSLKLRFVQRSSNAA